MILLKMNLIFFLFSVSNIFKVLKKKKSYSVVRRAVFHFMNPEVMALQKYMQKSVTDCKDIRYQLTVN